MHSHANNVNGFFHMQIPTSRISVTGLSSTHLYACGIYQDLVIIYYSIKHVQ